MCKLQDTTVSWKTHNALRHKGLVQNAYFGFSCHWYTRTQFETQLSFFPHGCFHFLPRPMRRRSAQAGGWMCRVCFHSKNYSQGCICLKWIGGEVRNEYMINFHVLGGTASMNRRAWSVCTPVNSFQLLLWFPLRKSVHGEDRESRGVGRGAVSARWHAGSLEPWLTFWLTAIVSVSPR